MRDWRAVWRHPIADSPGTYRSWWQMRDRCHNPNAENYERYGYLGISVCASWFDSYDAFVDDMGFRPDGTSIDRIDSLGDYEPGNCRWATDVQQNRNRKSNLVLTYANISKPAVQWAEDLGVNRHSFYSKVRHLGGHDTIRHYLGRLDI